GRLSVLVREARLEHAAVPTHRGVHPSVLLHALLLQLARESAAMNAEPPRGFGNVEVGVYQRLMNALPLERLDRGGSTGERDFGVAGGLAEGFLDVVGVRRFGQIVTGAELDGLHRGGNAGKA